LVGLETVPASTKPEHYMPLDLSSEVAVRWNDCDAKFVPLLKEGGITTVLLASRNEVFETACREAGLKVRALEEIQFFSLESINRASPKALVALTEGLWPGVGRPVAPTVNASSPCEGPRLTPGHKPFVSATKAFGDARLIDSSERNWISSGA